MMVKGMLNVGKEYIKTMLNNVLFFYVKSMLEIGYIQWR